MTRLENIRSRLRDLVQHGSLPASDCSRDFLAFVQPLLDARLVEVRRAGAGRALEITNAAAVSAWISERFPVASPDPGSARVSAVAQFRDSKVLPSDAAPTVQVRCWDDAALLRGGRAAAAVEATKCHGVLTFLLDDPSLYTIAQPAALIENPAVFHHFEKLGFGSTLPLAIYGGGRLPKAVLAWLAAQQSLDFRLVHFPDYDPVGLSEFLRLRSALGDRASLYVPENLERAFQRFGNGALLRNRSSQALLAKLRFCEIQEVKAVVRLIDEFNAGLEQEALLT